MSIHPLALVDPSVQLSGDVHIGPFTVVDKGVSLGENVMISSHCHLKSGTVLNEGVELNTGVVIGSDPQDLKYQGEETQVIIGSGSVIREYVTINKGTAASGLTQIGENCLVMAYTHIAHDCVIGDDVIIANGVQMGGHVKIGSHSVVSGMTGIHQFTTIGCGSFVGGGLRVAKDILPFSKALGEPLSWAGVNAQGLQKRGFSEESVSLLKQGFRMLKSEGQEAFLSTLERGKELQLKSVFEAFFEEQSRSYL